MSGLKFKKNSLVIFVCSTIVSLFALIAERAVGIDWDFHPDSVTYATESIDVSRNVINDGFFSVFNNFYYLIVAILGMNIYVVIAMNIFLFSVTNVSLNNFHERLITQKTGVTSYVSLLLLFNPYRIHLSTTMLKDSLLIYLFVASLTVGLRYRYLISLVAVRLASMIYYVIFFKKSYLYILGVLGIAAIFLVPGAYELIEGFNAQEMDFRDFNTVPSYQEYGVFGSLVRACVWPTITITGLYLALSPSILFFPLAIGQWMQIYYMKKMGLNIFDVRVFSVLFIFSLLVTGYTSYLRYILPIMVVAPFVGVLRLKYEKN